MNRIKLNARVLIRNLRVQNVHGRPGPLPPTGARSNFFWKASLSIENTLNGIRLS